MSSEMDVAPLCYMGVSALLKAARCFYDQLVNKWISVEGLLKHVRIVAFNESVVHTQVAQVSGLHAQLGTGQVVQMLQVGQAERQFGSYTWC